MEKRASRRVEVDDETSLSTKDVYFSAVLTNISMGGLFLKTNKCIELGDKVEICIPLPDNQGKHEIVVNVIAVRIMDNGIAFKFQNLDEETYSALFHLTSGSHA
jgi:Tfp pilus assembly protein PilZ